MTVHICMKCRPKFTTDCLYTCPFYFRIILLYIHLKDTPRGHNYLPNLLAKTRKLLFLNSRPFNQGTWCWTTVPSTITLPHFVRCLFMSGPSGGHIEMMLCLGFCSIGLGPGMLSLERALNGCFYFIREENRVDSNQIQQPQSELLRYCECLLYCENHTYISFTSANGCPLISSDASQHSHSFGYSLSLSLAHSLWPTLLGSIMSSVIAVRPCALCIPSLLCGRLMRIGEISMPLLDMSHTLRCWTNPCPFLALSLAGLFLFNSARAACCSLVLGGMYSWRPAYCTWTQPLVCKLTYAALFLTQPIVVSFSVSRSICWKSI